MWSRVVLKDRAKVAFKRNYWRCVLISFILLLFTGGATNTARTTNHDDGIVTDSIEDDWGNDIDINGHYISNYTHGGSIVSWIARSVITIILSGIAILMLLLKIFVFQPLEIGGCRFFVENTYGMPGVERILFAFKSGHYGKMVLTLFLKNLFVFLWSLLLVVPGIVKAYEYRMIPYLLADCPEMRREDAFRISKEMMYGQKMEAFILDLSFIGWLLLSAVTCGIAGVFYVSPYMHATNAELFLVLRGQYFQRQAP